MGRLGNVCCVVLVFAVTTFGRVWAGEIVEPWDDGTTPHRRYDVDEAGQRDGRYLEYSRDGKTVVLSATYRHGALDGSYLESFESGRPKVRTSYRVGKREGRFESFGPDGEPTEVAAYLAGAFEGKRQVWRAKKLVVTQTWKAGQLATIDGAVAFPRTADEVKRTVERILSGELPANSPAPKARPKAGGKPAVAPPPVSSSPAMAAAPPDLDALRDEALRRLRAYRYVCAVPWEDLVAGEAATLAAQYASLICAKLGHITHEPSNPGLPDEVFQLCAKGASECNLHLGVGMTGKSAVDGWMDDSDPTNIDRVGHRCWALALALRNTGFGFSEGAERRMAAMFTMDYSRNEPPDMPFVVYPARGWTPSEMFSSHHAFSVHVDSVAARLGLVSAKVRVRRLSSDFVPAADDLPIEMMPYNPDGRIGGRPVLIFRPKGIEVADGVAYLVELSVLDAKSRKPVVFLRWVAGFLGDRATAEDEPVEDDETK